MAGLNDSRLLGVPRLPLLSRPIAREDTQTVTIPAYNDRDLFDAIRIVADLLNVRPKSHGAGHYAGVFKVARPIDDDGFGIVEAIGVLPRHDVETRISQMTAHFFRDAGNAAAVEYLDADYIERIRLRSGERFRFRFGGKFRLRPGRRFRLRPGDGFRFRFGRRGSRRQPSLDVEDDERCKGQRRQNKHHDFS